MKKEKKDKHFIHKPIYPGGIKAMREFVRAHKKYPKEALDKDIEGTVYIKYDINYKGKVVSTNVMSGIGYGCDEEAERVVKLLKFKVAKTRKVKVLFHRKIQIHFKKPIKKKATKKITYTYSVTTAKKPENKPKLSTSYTITIKN